MTSIMSPAASNEQPFKGLWYAAAPYAVPIASAAFAIVPAFPDMIAKSAEQKGEPIPSMPYTTHLKKGIKAMPTVGLLVGMQMALQSAVEKRIVGESNVKSLTSALASSAFVGLFSSPVVAVFNGQTMSWSVSESLRRLSLKQCAAIACQETGFVGGLSIAGWLDAEMKKSFGDHKAIDFTAASIAGAAGSFIGHPANTAFTRWQNDLQVNISRQLMWGVSRRTRAGAIFGLGYKIGKDLLKPDSSKS